MLDVARTKEPKRILSAEQTAEMLRKERLVMEERIKGKSFYKIEREHGIPNADRIWRRAIGRAENIEFKRAEAIRLEELRLDALQEGIWPKALNGEPRAVEVALKVLERRARMAGLDFADMVSGQLVEVEHAKVKIMGAAFVAALQEIGASEDQRKQATATFFAQLRSVQAEQAQLGPTATGEDLL